MDAGCEKDSYVSDITRTWPVNGAFSTPQRALYDIVYNAHQACLNGTCVIYVVVHLLLQN